MTHPTLDHEERLRSALRAAADSVEPAADGLGRIRARLTPPRPVIAAWMVTGTEPAMLRLRLVATWLRLRLGLAHRQLEPVAGRARPALGRIAAAFTGIMPARGEPRTRAAWLRPAGALAAFVVIIGSGALAIGQLQQPVSSVGDSAAAGHRGAHARTSGSGGLAGAGTPSELKRTGWLVVPLTPQLSTGLPAPNPRKASPSPSSTCPPSPTPSPTPTPTSPPPSQSPTPTPTPTSPPPSQSPTPTPTPTGSGSPSPGASVMPTSSAAPTGASVNTVAYLGSPATGSTVSPSPASNKSACAPPG